MIALLRVIIVVLYAHNIFIVLNLLLIMLVPKFSLLNTKYGVDLKKSPWLHTSQVCTYVRRYAPLHVQLCRAYVLFCTIESFCVCRSTSIVLRTKLSLRVHTIIGKISFSVILLSIMQYRMML